MKRKIGLVLDGGGARGAYQIGVFKTLKELGIYKDVAAISGASVGALNACLFPIYNLNPKVIENIWINEIEDKILNFDINRIIKSELFNDFFNSNSTLKIINFFKFLLTSGIFSREGLIDIMNNYLDVNMIKTINIYVSCTKVADLNAYYFNLNNYSLPTMKQILLASSAIPTIFPAENIEGESYIDGGVSNNSPIFALRNEKCTDIIAIHLKKDKSYSVTAKKNLAKYVNIYEIFPQQDLGHSFGGTFDFSRDFAQKCMIQGYKESKNYLKKIFK